MNSILPNLKRDFPAMQTSPSVPASLSITEYENPTLHRMNSIWDCVRLILTEIWHSGQILERNKTARNQQPSRSSSAHCGPLLGGELGRQAGALCFQVRSHPGDPWCLPQRLAWENLHKCVTVNTSEFTNTASNHQVWSTFTTSGLTSFRLALQHGSIFILFG